MTKLDRNWQAQMRSRFSDREDIGRDQVYELFFAPAGLPRADVLDLLTFIEIEFDIPAGLLRPTDRLEKLTKPVKPDGVWQWQVYQVRSGDAQFAIDEALTKRLKRFGTAETWQKIETVADLVRAWCGKMPLANTA